MKVAKTKCMQISVDVARWPDDMLSGLFTGDDGVAFSGPRVREHLVSLREQGYRVVPCGRHKCEADGTCTAH